TTNYQKADVSRATAQRIKMEVKDGYAYFSYPDDAATLQVTKLEHSDVLAADRPILVKATIRNTGEEFVDNLCVALLNSNGAIVGKSVAKNVDVQNGAEVVLETTVTTLSTGNFKLAVLRVADYSVVSGVQESVTIGATPADINMSIVSPLKLTGSVIPTTHLEGTTTISNNGGAFAGRLEAFILAEGSNSILSRVFSEFVTIKKGERKEVKFNTSFTRGEVGQAYRIVLRNPHNTSGNYIWGDFVNFTIGTPVRGDVNLDGVADVSDVTALINYVLSGGGSPFDKTEADFNGDGVIDVTDATAIINLVLN
ncbi:MAG: dockerin type I domain-containing protein, partial [Sodaliphilus sp.]|nr:dockerin type I domain-containing protein [Sodaliphilus sp.]